MRIKHYQGYGIVQARNIKDKKYGSDLHIQVTGNHEWGLVREDVYDVYHWLVKKFNKEIESTFKEKAEEITKSTNKNIIYTVKYKATIEKNIMSLIIK